MPLIALVLATLVSSSPPDALCRRLQAAPAELKLYATGDPSVALAYVDGFAGCRSAMSAPAGYAATLQFVVVRDASGRRDVYARGGVVTNRGARVVLRVEDKLTGVSGSAGFAAFVDRTVVAVLDAIEAAADARGDDGRGGASADPLVDGVARVPVIDVTREVVPVRGDVERLFCRDGRRHRTGVVFGAPGVPALQARLVAALQRRCLSLIELGPGDDEQAVAQREDLESVLRIMAALDTTYREPDRPERATTLRRATIGVRVQAVAGRRASSAVARGAPLPGDDLEQALVAHDARMAAAGRKPLVEQTADAIVDALATLLGIEAPTAPAALAAPATLVRNDRPSSCAAGSTRRLGLVRASDDSALLETRVLHELTDRCFVLVDLTGVDVADVDAAAAAGLDHLVRLSTRVDVVADDLRPAGGLREFTAVVTFKVVSVPRREVVAVQKLTASAMGLDETRAFDEPRAAQSPTARRSIAAAVAEQIAAAVTRSSTR